jgi:hypothetical protein
MSEKKRAQMLPMPSMQSSGRPAQQLLLPCLEIAAAVCLSGTQVDMMTTMMRVPASDILSEHDIAVCRHGEA